MKARSTLTAAALFAAALFILDVPAANADSYRSAQSGDWDQLSTWQIFNDPSWATPTEEQGVPACGDNANIRNSHTVDVDTSENVDYVTVDSGGCIDIQDGGTLTLCAASTSTINQAQGVYLSSSTSVLAISANHTLSGSGSVKGQGNSAMIDDDGNSRTLTIASGFTIQGALTVDLSLVNNGTVLADDGTTADTRDRLTINNGTYTGSGTYEVNTASAFLEFDATGVTADELATDFKVSDGTLDIQVPTSAGGVSTTGGLCFIGGTISVDSSCSFTATGTPASCP